MLTALDEQQKLFERMETAAEERHHEEQIETRDMFEKMEDMHYQQEQQLMKEMGDRIGSEIEAASKCNIL